jgi:competence protein ComEA
VYELRSGARVHDAIAAAGGAVGDAELDALNLASLLGDGERVYVPRPGEAVIAPVDQGRAQPQTPLDLNTATAEELDALPGVGPSIARSIVDDRNRNGPFAAVDDLTRVRGIGPAKLEELRSLVRV